MASGTCEHCNVLVQSVARFKHPATGEIKMVCSKCLTKLRRQAERDTESFHEKVSKIQNENRKA